MMRMCLRHLAWLLQSLTLNTAAVCCNSLLWASRWKKRASHRSAEAAHLGMRRRRICLEENLSNDLYKPGKCVALQQKSKRVSIPPGF